MRAFREIVRRKEMKREKGTEIRKMWIKHFNGKEKPEGKKEREKKRDVLELTLAYAKSARCTTYKMNKVLH